MVATGAGKTEGEKQCDGEESGRGGGEEARGNWQSPPSLCSIRVSDARQPF